MRSSLPADRQLLYPVFPFNPIKLISFARFLHSNAYRCEMRPMLSRPTLSYINCDMESLHRTQHSSNILHLIEPISASTSKGGNSYMLKLVLVTGLLGQYKRTPEEGELYRSQVGTTRIQGREIQRLHYCIEKFYYTNHVLPFVSFIRSTLLHPYKTLINLTAISPSRFKSSILRSSCPVDQLASV